MRTEKEIRDAIRVIKGHVNFDKLRQTMKDDAKGRASIKEVRGAVSLTSIMDSLEWVLGSENPYLILRLYLDRAADLDDEADQCSKN